MSDYPTLKQIQEAKEKLRSLIVETPAHPWHDPWLSDRIGHNTEVFVKLELLQVTGTFKPRGALNVMFNLDKSQLNRGVTTVSAGNHAIATAYASKVLGTTAKVVMPKNVNPLRMQMARDLGADVSIDASDGRFLEAVQEAGGADVVLDMVGAAYAEQNLKALKPGGRWVVIAFQSGNLAQVDLSRLMRSRLTLTGSTLRARAADEKARLAEAVEATLWPWVADGRIKPIVDRVFPLEEAAAAHRRLESGSHTGKVVLTT